MYTFQKVTWLPKLRSFAGGITRVGVPSWWLFVGCIQFAWKGRTCNSNRAVRQLRHYNWLRARWLAGLLQRDYWESSCGQTGTKWLRMYRTAHAVKLTEKAVSGQRLCTALSRIIVGLMFQLLRWLESRGIKISGTKSLFMIISHDCITVNHACAVNNMLWNRDIFNKIVGRVTYYTRYLPINLQTKPEGWRDAVQNKASDSSCMLLTVHTKLE